MALYGSRADRRAKSRKKPKPELEPGKVQRQTTRSGGRRIVITTRMNKDGEVKVKTEAAPPLEWRLQAAQITAMRRHRRFGSGFLYAGSMEAGKRGPKAQMEAVATGMVSGEPDVRLYFSGGKTIFVENKSGKGRLSKEQKERHADLLALAFDVHTVWADSEESASTQILQIIDDHFAGIAG